MGSKQKKGFRKSIDDVLDDLLGEDDGSPNKPASVTTHSGSNIRTSVIAPSRTSRKSLLDDDFFSKLAQDANKDNEESEISDADPQALLVTMKDIDDMDADLFGKSKKLHSVPSQPTGNAAETESSTLESARTTHKPAAVKDVTGENEKRHSAPATSKRQYKKFTFDDEEDVGLKATKQDVDDPLAGIISDEEEERPKKAVMTGRKPSPSSVDLQKHKKEEKGMPTPKKKDELFFDDEGDDLMDALGFGDSPKAPEEEKKAEEEPPRPARSKMDELLGRGTAKKLLERPITGERKEFKLDPKYKKTQEKEDFLDDFTFGSYHPTVVTTPEDRQSRRQSVRFSPEGDRSSTIDQKPKEASPTPTTPTLTRGNKSAADWLGLKDDVIPDLDNQMPTKDKEKGTMFYKAKSESNLPASHNQSKRPFSADHPPSASKAIDKTLARSAPSTAKADLSSVVEGDWLKEALARKKTRATEAQPQTSGDDGDATTSLCKKNGSPSAPGQCPITSVKEPAPKSNPVESRDSGSPFPWENARRQTTPPLGTHTRKDTNAKMAEMVASSQELKDDQLSAFQVSLSTDQLQKLLQFQLLQSVSGGRDLAVDLPNAMDLESRLSAVQKQLKSTEAEQQTILQDTEVKIIELESKVRKLELEREQQRILLDSLQQQHNNDLELIENAHRTRLKVIEESYQQREARLQEENQILSEQHVARQQSLDRERSELIARYQCKLTEFEEEKAKEKERLRDLQRQSILDMRKEHEDQLQHVKQLKEQEIDAVTSASSHTRSLNNIIEQMGAFSVKLNDLSYKVESTHQNTSHEMELNARQRDEQQRAQQDRLMRQQRDLEEERARLQDVITKMEIRLNEQTRLLEKERWRATAEQTKVESVQRSLEEERRIMNQHFSIEREELERAKSALLEEQQSVMHRCAEERRRLASEWAEFHTQQKLNNERIERGANRTLQLNAQQEGTVFSLAKEQAELKMKSTELRSKGEQLAQEREILNQERHELQMEKERVNTMAIRIKQRAEEVEGMSKLASQKFEEGEQKFMDAKRVESEHQARLHAIQRKMERLQQQEQQLHQERLSLAQQRHHPHKLTVEMPINTVTPHIRNQAISFANHSYFPPVLNNARHGLFANPRADSSIESTRPSELEAKLAIFRHAAKKDRDFLEDEQFFLETLKKAPYNTTSQTV
ncbi:fas-binding factor 1 homolog isoform X2 [Scyliorhinus canicula]|uniref:fas-binding factor 1 homolog isoform X2 n=1 Tax=Scyliorhinus canicula TaxID=7830 RepID=UPI0018F55FD2|nr:fas-binding factor 1 homolog isoform X2 [Scyliorhinus canicula]XP_038632414.1 fas-binding factor 1 homolog isoform X2 [Scyliorhinus canicula]XP_038632415.1 fas-binding factor 1 homolog isoform X2 [Scyliorhinus canicula]XP_038632416.1 fas-binding factor 1 homolog isoform X2 [Scyliorhinus canicula]